MAAYKVYNYPLITPFSGQPSQIGHIIESGAKFMAMYQNNNESSRKPGYNAEASDRGPEQ